jgi:hypothetical protein
VNGGLYLVTVFPYHPIFLNAFYLRDICQFYYLSTCSHVLDLYNIFCYSEWINTRV